MIQKKQINDHILLYILVSNFPIYLHFDWLLAYEQFVIGLNSDVAPVDTRFLQVNMMSFLQIIVFYVISTNNSLATGSPLAKLNMAVAEP